MSIVLLVGVSKEADYEHRFVVSEFLKAIPDLVKGIIIADIPPKPLSKRIAYRLRKGEYIERMRRFVYDAVHRQDDPKLGRLLFPDGLVETMPGGDLRRCVPNHNGDECEDIIKTLKPDVIAVYGTRLIEERISSLAGKVTLNLHTGLSPYYRGDSTLFWPIFHEDFDRIGVTVHRLEPEVDAGDIVSTGKVRFEPGDDEAKIFAKAMRLGTKLYVEAVVDALADRIVYQQQDLSLGREYLGRQRTVDAEKQVRSIMQRTALSRR